LHSSIAATPPLLLLPLSSLPPPVNYIPFALCCRDDVARLCCHLTSTALLPLPSIPPLLVD